MNPLLVVKQLSVYFNAQPQIISAVNDISFSIQASESVALVGESGSGKTLTALAIAQLLPVAANISKQSQIILQQQDLLQLSEIELRSIRGRRIGIIFQEALTALNPVLTIGEQINEVLKWHFNLAKAERWQRILALLAEVGIVDTERCAKSYSHQLSGGMRQRAMIAIALAGEPQLLIADEPTTALDVRLQAQILQLLRNLQKTRGMSLLFITHDLSIARQLADRILVMQAGKIIEENSTANYFKQPQQDYSRNLLAALPDWQKRGDKFIAQPSGKPLLMVNNLQVYFPSHKMIFRRTRNYVKAVEQVSFNIYSGRTLALVGESGSGKTTAAKAILRLIPATSGSVIYLNNDLIASPPRRMRALRRDLQIIFQDPYAAMNPRMIVKDILEEGMLAQGLGKNANDRSKIIYDLLRRVGLSADVIYRYPHEFSGGQRQRLCIARALAMRPKFIICDEPTSALDIIVQMQILQLLRELQQEFALSYLLITHNLQVVAYMAHEVAVMQAGRIVEHGSVDKILFQPQHEYTRQLLAAIPQS